MVVLALRKELAMSEFSNPHSADKEPQFETLDELNRARENGGLTTFDYVRSGFQIVANIFDERETQTSNIETTNTNREIVDQLVDSDDFKNLYGQALNKSVNPGRFMVMPDSITPRNINNGRYMKPVYEDDIRDGSVRKSYTYDSRRTNSTRIVAERMLTSEPYPEDIENDSIHPLDLYAAAFMDLGAYRYIDGLARELIASCDSTRPAPGFEEKFWQSRILGSKQRTGLATALGFAHKMDRKVKNLSKALHGEDAQRYADAYMALCITGSRPNNMSNPDLLDPIIDPLLKNDIVETEYQIKSLLFRHPEVLPYPTQKKYELTIDEEAFFEELFNKGAAKEDSDTNTNRQPLPIEAQPGEYDEAVSALEYARRLIGKLAMVDREDETQYFYVRALKPHQPRSYSKIINEDSTFSPIAWDVDALRYDEVNDGYVRRKDKSVSSLFAPDTLWNLREQIATFAVSSKLEPKANSPDFIHTLDVME